MNENAKLMELAESERPQERLQRLGASALSETELLAMLLRSGSKGHNFLNVASNIINDAGSLSNLVSWDDSEFRRFKGIGKVKALQLVTVVEICRRVLAASTEANPILDAPKRIFEFMRSRAIGLEIEKFWTLCLDRKNRLIRSCEVTSGTASHSLAHPREVFREAIRHGSSAIICVHNHPSGDPSPSAADIKVTRQLREASQTIGIDLLDHIIIGSPQKDPNRIGYYSFQKCGIL
jgi:DNA repair protein RadC